METKSKLLNPRKLDLSQVGSAIGLILVVIVASIITQGNFLSASNLTNVFRQVTIMGFASLGMCIVIITGNIDLSIIGNVLSLIHIFQMGVWSILSGFSTIGFIK